MIAVELTTSTVIAADVQRQGKAWRVKASMRAPLPYELTTANADKLGSWLKERLRENKIGSGDAVILVGRGLVSLKPIRVPIVPDNELPSIVSFSLEGNTSQVGETTVDYQPGAIHPSSSADAGDELEVFTAVSTVETIDSARKMFAKAGLNPKRIAPRPYGSFAAVPAENKSATSDVLLFITDDTIEVSVWTGPQLRICRTIVPTSGSITPDRCINELRRTLAAFHADAASEDVARVRTMGCDAATLAEAVTRETRIPADAIPQEESSAETLALIGAASISDSKAPWPIDFLRPKKAVAPTNRNRLVGLLGALAAVLVGGAGFVHFTRQLKERDARITSLQNELAEINNQIKELKPLTERHEVISQWIKSGDPLLDELQEVAQALPDTSDMILTGLEYNAGQNDQPGTIKLDGLSRDQSIVTRAQTEFASSGEHRYAVQPRGLDPGADVGAFVWRFGLDLVFDPLSVSEYAARSGNRSKAVSGLSPGGDMVRKEMPLTRTPKTAESASTKKTKEAKPADSEKASSASTDGSSKGSELMDKKLEDLAKLSPEEREAAINKEPKYFQKRLRKALEKRGQ